MSLSQYRTIKSIWSFWEILFIHSSNETEWHGASRNLSKAPQITAFGCSIFKTLRKTTVRERRRKCGFFFHGPIRSDDQPPVPHIVSIFSIQRDPVFPSWFALCLQPSILWCYWRMTSLVFHVFHVFASHSLSPESYTSPARTRRLWWCVQRRRVCDVQQILEAVWWCQAPWGCCRLFYVQSNWLVTSDDKSTVLLIGSFSHQLLWESSLLRHRWELSTPASVLVSFSDLWWFLCLSISVQDRAFFSWPFQFGIWCLYYNCRQLLSVSRDIWNVQPPQFLHHPLKLLHRTASSQFSEVWSFSHLISVTLIFLWCWLFWLVFQPPLANLHKVRCHLHISD